MLKAGASDHDKNWIAKLMFHGHTVEQISAITSVRPEHVTGVIQQINNGKLRVRGKLSYGHGDSDSPQAQGGAVAMMQVENNELKERLDRMEAQLSNGGAGGEAQTEDQTQTEENPAGEASPEGSGDSEEDLAEAYRQRALKGAETKRQNAAAAAAAAAE